MHKKGFPYYRLYTERQNKKKMLVTKAKTFTSVPVLRGHVS